MNKKLTSNVFSSFIFHPSLRRAAGYGLPGRFAKPCGRKVMRVQLPRLPPCQTRLPAALRWPQGHEGSTPSPSAFRSGEWGVGRKPDEIFYSALSTQH